MRKRLLSLALCAAVLATLLVIPAAGTTNLAFVAVNDTIPLTLSGGELPIYANGAVYVPYTVFSTVDIYPIYSASTNTISLTGRSGRLTYDLTNGTVNDETNTTQSIPAVIRNGVIFVPVTFTANHFGLQCSLLNSQSGYLVVRFTTGAQVYDDGLFVTKAENLIAYRVEQFEASQKEPDEPEEPAVSKPSTGGETTTTPKPTDPTEEEEAPATVHLAITDASTMGDALTLLQQESLPAVFFFTEEELLEQPDLVRQVAVAGYGIGLAVDDRDDRPMEEALRAANDALDHTLGRKSLLCLLPDTADAATVMDRYCVHLRPSSRLTASAAAEAHGESVVLICDSTQLANGLPILQEDKAEFAQLTETTVLS